MTATITVERVTAPTPEVRALVEELEETLAALYSPEQRHGLSLDGIFRPEVRFFVARVGGAAVGCGGVALAGGFAELKRMFVRPAQRGSGVAQALIARLEEEARAAGHTRLCLETGRLQDAAMRFYEKAGFRRCGAFGDYAAMAPESVAASVFYDKTIAR